MTSSGKILLELAMKKTSQLQNDQTVTIKANKRLQKNKISGLDVSITMPMSVTVTEIISTVLGSTADESRPAEAAITDLRTDMPAIAYMSKILRLT